MILATKLSVPAVRADLVDRSPLVGQLQDGVRRKVSLLSASAGFGKTTLIAQWLQSVDRAFSWYTVDEGDNDPVRFAEYLIAACANVDESIGRAAAALLRSSPAPHMESILGALINEIAAADIPFVLVLDDYHHLESGQIHEAMQFLIDHQPPQLHLVIAGRQDPPLALARLRARNEINEIRANGLRLDRSAAAQFLNRSMKLNLTDKNIADLEARTEGWLAGLQLAALALRDAGDADQEGRVDDFVREFRGTHRVVFDYLAEEVLRRQPPEICDFLVKTSILKRFTAPLCDDVSGRTDSAEILRELTRDNLLIQPLDSGGSWYRYHALFSDFLQSIADSALLPALHLRAARWFAEEGWWDEAVSHALSSGEYDRAVPMIVSAAEEVIRNGSFATLQGWITRLPDSSVRSNRDLSVLAGTLSVFASRFVEAADYASAAEHAPAVTSVTTQSPGPNGRLLSLRAQLALCDGNVDSAATLCRSALDSLATDDFFFRDLTSNILGQCLEMTGDLQGASDVYRSYMDPQGRSMGRSGSGVVLTNLIIALNALGRRNEAVALCSEIAAMAEFGDAPGFLGDAMCLGWSLLSYEGNELDSALMQVTRALALCEGANMVPGIVWGRYILARIHAAKGDPAAALESVRAARKFTVSGIPHQGWFRAIELDLALRSGNGTRARNLADLQRLLSSAVPEHCNDVPLTSYRHSYCSPRAAAAMQPS